MKLLTHEELVDSDDEEDFVETIESNGKEENSPNFNEEKDWFMNLINGENDTNTKTSTASVETSDSWLAQHLQVVRTPANLIALCEVKLIYQEGFGCAQTLARTSTKHFHRKYLIGLGITGLGVQQTLLDLHSDLCAANKSNRSAILAQNTPDSTSTTTSSVFTPHTPTIVGSASPVTNHTTSKTDTSNNDSSEEVTDTIDGKDSTVTHSPITNTRYDMVTTPTTQTTPSVTTTTTTSQVPLAAPCALTTLISDITHPQHTTNGPLPTLPTNTNNTTATDTTNISSTNTINTTNNTTTHNAPTDNTTPATQTNNTNITSNNTLCGPFVMMLIFSYLATVAINNAPLRCYFAMMAGICFIIAISTMVELVVGKE